MKITITIETEPHSGIVPMTVRPCDLERWRERDKSGFVDPEESRYERWSRLADAWRRQNNWRPSL